MNALYIVTNLLFLNNINTNKASTKSANKAKPAKTVLSRPKTSNVGYSLSECGGKTAGEAILAEIVLAEFNKILNAFKLYHNIK